LQTTAHGTDPLRQCTRRCILTQERGNMVIPSAKNHTDSPIRTDTRLVATLTPYSASELAVELPGVEKAPLEVLNATPFGMPACTPCRSDTGMYSG